MELKAGLGIFARTFRRESAAQVAAAIAEAGYALAHWNFAAIGVSTLAANVDSSQFLEVRSAFCAAGLQIPSVSATFNTVHPDAATRRSATRDAVRLIAMAPLLGADVVTLCSGTRDPQDMWRAHPDNSSIEAWTDLRGTLDILLEAASAAGVRLGIEPEPGNIVADADIAARLLREVGDDAPLGIVFDPANLLTPDTVNRQDEILGHALDLLGPHVLSAHAKDVVTAGYSAAGAGLMDYRRMLAQLDRIPAVPLIVQDVDEGDAGQVRVNLQRWYQDVHRGQA